LPLEASINPNIKEQCLDQSRIENKALLHSPHADQGMESGTNT
jgi:hypothetical protein